MQALSTLPADGSFNSFDWFLILLLVISTVTAFMRGFIKALFSLGGFLLGIIFAAWNYLAVATALHRIILSFEVAEVVAFILILVVVAVLFSVIAGLLRKAVAAVGLGFLDRLLGAAFGFLRGCLLGAAVMMAVLAFVPKAPLVENSQLAPYFLGAAHAVSFVVPEQFQQQVASGAAHLLRATPKMLRPHTLTQPLP